MLYQCLEEVYDAFLAPVYNEDQCSRLLYACNDRGERLKVAIRQTARLNIQEFRSSHHSLQETFSLQVNVSQFKSQLRTPDKQRLRSFMGPVDEGGVVYRPEKKFVWRYTTHPC